MLSESTTLTLLTADSMRIAEQSAIRSGVSGNEQMQRAGAAVAEAITRLYTPMPVRILCGPGNNGGDGFVAAAALRAAGWEVEVASLLAIENLQGDARLAADAWGGVILPLEDVQIDRAALYVDALFGTGLTRPLEGIAARVMERLAIEGVTLVAIDILSGVNADSGETSGTLPYAAATITFSVKKPGHFLLPGALHAGEVACVDIGISKEVDAVGTEEKLFENRPPLWLSFMQWPQPMDHKYTRGSVVVFGGQAEMTGASRLAARAALRAGAGAVTLACHPATFQAIAAHVTSIMTYVFGTPEEFSQFIAGDKHKAIILGPGAGANDDTRACVLAALDTGKPTVLDADALMAFEEYPQTLFDRVRADVIMTPHSGELNRLFGGLNINLQKPKWLLGREVAAKSGMVTVLKGYDTVIASPDGRVAINSNGTPVLATAGSGDILAGIIGSLCAQGMPAFEAACAGVSLHAEAGRRFGLGLIAEDLPEILPNILKELVQL